MNINNYNINTMKNFSLVDRNKLVYEQLYEQLHEKLFNICKETCFFSFVPDNFTESYNWRTSFFIAYFIKEYVKDKHFCHIGGASGDLELILSKYAKKITIIDSDKSRLSNAQRKKEKNLYNCPVDIIGGNFNSDSVTADTYFTWCDLATDRGIINSIINKDKSCTILSPTIPWYYLEDSKTFENNIVDNFLIPFDENYKLSYYANNMMQKDDNIIMITDELVYVYKKISNDDIKLIKTVNSEKFNYTGYINYTHSYLNNTALKEKTSPASKIENTLDNFITHTQGGLRGYITLGAIKLVK